MTDPAGGFGRFKDPAPAPGSVVAWEQLQGVAFFYGFLTFVLAFLWVTGRSGGGFSARVSEGYGYPTRRLYGPYRWLGDRVRVLVPAGLAVWVVGTALGLLAPGALAVVPLFAGAMGFLVAGFSVVARSVASAAEEAVDEEEPPEEYPWRRHVASHLVIWGVVFGAFWYGGTLDRHPWLWLLFVLGLLQIPASAYWNARRYDEAQGDE